MSSKAVPKTIRPVIIERIIQVMDLISHVKKLTLKELMRRIELLEHKKQMSERRLREVLNECISIGLLNKFDKYYSISKVGIEFIDFLHKGDKITLSNILRSNYPPYEILINTLDSIEGEISDTDLINLLRNNSEFYFNQVSVNHLLNIAEKLGAVQRRLFYFEKKHDPNYYSINPNKNHVHPFIQSLIHEYNTLKKAKTRIGFSSPYYASIPHLRELVCSQMQISRTTFDEFFEKIYQLNFDTIEILSSPIFSKAKNVNLSLRVLHLDSNLVNKQILPATESSYVLEGVAIDGRRYSYVRIMKLNKEEFKE